jgi:hypothetical protein
LRKRYGRSADAAAASIASELKDFAASRSGSASLKWPVFTNWLNEKFADHWEIVSFNSETADYGVSNWKDRQLDTAFTRITVQLKNRMLGEYQDACFVAGQITSFRWTANRFSCPASVPIRSTAGKPATVSKATGSSTDHCLTRQKHEEPNHHRDRNVHQLAAG